MSAAEVAAGAAAEDVAERPAVRARWQDDEQPLERAAVGSYEAVDPDGVPELQATIAAAGLGRLMPATASSRGGRNENWLAATTTGHAVFVKRLLGSRTDRRAQRESAFLDVAAAWGWADAADGGVTPRCIARGDEDRIRVFDGVHDATPAHERVTGGWELTTDEVRSMAGALAELHAAPVQPCERLGIARGAAEVLSDGALVALTVDEYVGCSGAMLELYGLIQADPLLPAAITAVHRAVRPEGIRRPVPIHGDLRLDQFLLTPGGRALLVDWEEFRVGEAAVDLGAFCGDVVHHAVRLARLEDEDPDADPATRVVAATAKELDTARGLLVAFADAYRQRRDLGDEELDLVVRRTGYHLLDRVLANAAVENALPQRSRATVGLAKQLLATPERWRGLLGWEHEETVTGASA